MRTQLTECGFRLLEIIHLVLYINDTIINLLAIMPYDLPGFCSRCKALGLNDLALGGRKVSTQSKDFCLELPLGQPEEEGCGNVPLQYQLRDEFPDFPRLTTTAQAGCIFCQLLKDAIVEFVFFDGAPIIDISMAYRWSCNTGGNLGLTGLMVDMRPIYPSIKPIQSNATQVLKFFIDGNSGEHHFTFAVLCILC